MRSVSEYIEASQFSTAYTSRVASVPDMLESHDTLYLSDRGVCPSPINPYISAPLFFGCSSESIRCTFLQVHFSCPKKCILFRHKNSFSVCRRLEKDRQNDTKISTFSASFVITFRAKCWFQARSPSVHGIRENHPNHQNCL